MRKTVEKAALGVLVVGSLAWIAYPMIQDQKSCDSSAPATVAQRVALDELKSRKASKCVGPGKGCQYLISEGDDGSIRIKFYDIYGATGNECLNIDCCYEDHVFTASGVYVRCDGCAA